MYGTPAFTVTLAEVRETIGDQARNNVAPGGMELLQPAPTDGLTSAFNLRFQNAQLTTVEVFAQQPVSTTPGAPTAPVAYAPVLQSDATNPWAAVVDSTGTPTVAFTSPPAAGLIFGCRYKVTAFSDTLLMTLLGDISQPNASLTLAEIHYQMIPKILASKEALTIYRLTSRTDDFTAWINAQPKVQQMLKEMLDEGAGEGPSGHGSSPVGYW